jgi:hypothetical protein
LRWQIETFFHRLKTRLCLENFSGKSAESVRQDFHMTVFISNLESVLTSDTDDELAKKNTVHLQTVNSAVSFHTIKSNIINLLLSNTPIEKTLADMKKQFLANPVSIRPHRGRKKRNTALCKQVNYYRRQAKIVF